MSYQNNEEVLQKKADYFLKTNQQVHIKYKKGYWKRGYISKVLTGFFILKVNLEGNFPVFYMEIESIELYQKKERKNG